MLRGRRLLIARLRVYAVGAPRYVLILPSCTVCRHYVDSLHALVDLYAVALLRLRVDYARLRGLVTFTLRLRDLRLYPVGLR